MREYKYFKLSDFDSPDRVGSGSMMNDDFVRKLDELRERFKAPLIITSGYRTPRHNSRVSTTGETGPHTTGRAADLRPKMPSSAQAFLLLKLAFEIGFTGIGLRQESSDMRKNFIHVDDLTEPDYPRPAFWTYPSPNATKAVLSKSTHFCYGSRAVDILRNAVKGKQPVIIWTRQHGPVEDRFISMELNEESNISHIHTVSSCYMNELEYDFERQLQQS